MTDIFVQFKNMILVPYGGQDADTIAGEYRNNQVLRCKLTIASEKLLPSIEQNNLLHACFELVAENDRTGKIKCKEGAKFACKVGIDFRYMDRIAVTPGGKVVAEYRSYSFGELHGEERNKIMDKSFQWCADQLGITVDELVEEAKSRMHSK